MFGRSYIGEAFFNSAQDYHITDIKSERGGKPREGEGEIKCSGGAVPSKDGVDPNNAETASADKADKHRGHRSAESAKHSRHNLHKSAKEVCKAHISHSYHTVFDDSRFIRRAFGEVDAKDLMSEKKGDDADGDSDNKNE